MNARAFPPRSPISPLLLLPLLAVLSTAACGEETKLGGSLGQTYDLSFDHMRARLYPTELSIEYVRYVGEDSEVIVRLTVRTTDTGLDGPATVDLARFGGVSGSSEGVDIPNLVSGTLFLRSYAPEEGADVEGDFDVLLQGTRGELTLHGEFSTNLDVVQ